MKRNALGWTGWRGAKKSGGPFWDRTRDLSLIRNTVPSEKIINRGSPCVYVSDWCNELELKGTAKITIEAYLGRVRSLLREYLSPNILDIKG